MAHNDALTKKRIAAVTKAGFFRTATGAKRSFNQAYGPKLHLESVEPGGAYVKGSDEQYHLLKRVLPVAANSAEPKGKLTQPRQYLHDTLRDLAEDLHAELLGQPQSLRDLAKTMDPKLESRDAKIKTKAFVEKFSDLFKLENDNVYALVLSHPKARSKKEVRIEPIEEEPPRPNVQMGGSSASTDRPNRAALYFQGVLAPPKLDPKTAAKNLAEHRAATKKEKLEKYAKEKKERDEKDAKETQAKHLRQADQIIKRGVR